MSRNTVVTPEGPGQGQPSSTTDINSSNTINDVNVIHNKQFLELQYPVYPPIYHYPLPQPLTSLLPIPASIPPQLSNHPSQSLAFQSKSNRNHKSRHHYANSRKNYKKNRNHSHHDACASNPHHKKQSPPLLIAKKSKPKTVDLSRDNSRGELETLVRWIGGDSVQIKHHCSQDSIHNQWRCVCTVPLPFKKKTNSLQTTAHHSKKKDAIKIASKLMIEEILKQALPIAIDIIGEDGHVTSIAAQILNQSSNDTEEAMDTNRNTSPMQNRDKSTPNEKTPTHVNEDKRRKDGNSSWTTHNMKHNNNHHEMMRAHAPPHRPPYDYDRCGTGSPPFPPYSHHHAYYAGDWCSYHHHHSCNPHSWSGYHHRYYGPTQPPPPPATSYPPYPMHHCGGYRTTHKKQSPHITPSDVVEETTSTVNGGDMKDSKDIKEEEAQQDEMAENEYLFVNDNNDTKSSSNTNDHETDDGVMNAVDITPKGPHMNSQKNNNTSDDDREDEYMNELKEEEEISPPQRHDEKQIELEMQPNTKMIEAKPRVMMRQGTNPNPNENGDENDMKSNTKNGEEKEMEGEKIFTVPPQRLLVLVPSQIEYKTIQSILPHNTQVFTFSKKLDIAGLVVPAFTHLPDSTELESMQTMQEAPGQQKRLYIVKCGTGLVNVSVSIATVVQTVHIDAILLLGCAISLQPKSIKPGHLLLANTVIQHDLCVDTNNAIFATHDKLSQWLRTLIAKGSEQENESLPVMYRGTLLSGSEIIKSESRISYLASATGEEEAIETTENCDEAMAVDRESISVAIICRTLRIPFAILKSIAPPNFDTQDLDFKAYDDTCSNNAAFDCNASLPLLKALLEQYRMFDY